MSSSNYLIRKAEEVMLRRERMPQEYDVDSARNQGAKPDSPAEKTGPGAAFANLVITRPDLLSLEKIQTFLSGHKVSHKPADLENPNPFQQAQAKDGAANVVQSTAL